MAKATYNPDKIQPTVDSFAGGRGKLTLELTVEEAITLSLVTGNVLGDGYLSLRKHTSEIHDVLIEVLNEEGFGEAYGYAGMTIDRTKHIRFKDFE